MTTATSGTTVKVHYTGTLEDGSEFDSSADRAPLQVTLGTGSVIPGFEEALIGMQVGERKTVTIPPERAYGPHQPEGVSEYPRDALPDGLEVFVGQRLQATAPNGQNVALHVVDVKEDSVTLDANHPLAGKELTFSLELVEIA